MNKRLQQFIHAENISQSQFADSIGVARASISHILAGRNKPGFDFIENLAKRYPALNIEWLITGKGKMYKSGAISDSQEDMPLFSDEQIIETQEIEPVLQFEPQIEQPEPVSPVVKEKPKKPALPVAEEKKISKIIVFYSDFTFEEFK